MRAVAGRDVVPKPVAAKREDQRRQHHRAAGNAALRERHREAQVARDLEARDFLLEAADRFIAVEPQMHGIGTHEALGINRARQLVVLALFDGRQVGRANLQYCSDAIDIAAIALARIAQQVADGMTRRAFRAGIAVPARQSCIAFRFERSAE